MKKSYYILLIIVGLFAQDLNAQDGFLGEIKMFAGNFAPRNWALCEGQLLPIARHQALFAILGTTYGGDGRTTFALPDMRGRVVVGTGHGPGLRPTQHGEMIGREEVYLNALNLPSAMVGIPAVDMATVENDYIEGNTSFLSVGNSPNSRIDVMSNYQGQPFSNLQPSIVVNYIICVDGIFPSRQ